MAVYHLVSLRRMQEIPAPTYLGILSCRIASNTPNLSNPAHQHTHIPTGQSEGAEWVANPPVSQAAVQRRRERHEAALLSYEAAEISVRLVPAEEGPRSDDDIDGEVGMSWGRRSQ